MNDETYHKMKELLEHGLDHERRHAEIRLAMPDALGYVPGDPPTVLKADPPLMNLDPVLLRIHGCPHYVPGCCARPMPYCEKYAFNPLKDQCVACLDGSPPR